MGLRGAWCTIPIHLKLIVRSYYNEQGAFVAQFGGFDHYTVSSKVAAPVAGIPSAHYRSHISISIDQGI